jgi:hypothetical protein
VLAQPGIAKPQTELPADYEQRLIKNDFAWASKNRDEILTEWRKRYDGKSEKVVPSNLHRLTGPHRWRLAPSVDTLCQHPRLLFRAGS